MKKILKSWALVAAAAMGAVACQKELQEEVPVTGETVQVTFVAGTADTKTSVDTSGDVPVFAWGENETFAVLEQTDALAAATSVTYAKVDGKAHITAEFAANPGKESYDYATIYPASGYVNATGLDEVTLSLPAVQTMAEGSYDPDADLMVSEVVSVNAQPTEAQLVRFTRMAAVVKMTLKNLDIAEGDEVEQVIFTAEGKALAGTITADLANPNGFTAAEGVDNVTVNTTSSNDVYFTVLPAVLEAGDAYTVAVITNKKLYIKKGTIPAEKSLVFEKGMVTRFGVNMEDVEPIDKWILVKDASTLKEGDVVTFVAKDYDMAISKELYSNASETSTSARRAAVAISKYQDYLIANENVQPFILVPGSSVGTFSFYDEGRAKFLVSNNKTSRYLINQAYVDSNTSFAITIDAVSGDATVMNIEGDYKDCMIRYYNSSKYFYSGTSANQAICVYKHAGVTGDIPVVDANVTVPDSDESVVIAEEGTAVATDISTEQVTFNYVGPWTISAEADAEWLNVAYDATKNCLTYTAEANTGAKRETTVTITASLEGQDDLSWSFKVIQKGVPQDISIADFVKLSKDENSTYRITGRITEITTSSEGTFKLTDGTNVATVTYLYTDAGVKVYGDNPMGLKVGDVMTVTTVPVGSGKGGNSSHHSIYKGHYGLKTTAGLAADYTGGTVEVSVETYSNGNIEIPEPVQVTIAESDFAELSYSDGVATVTFATENTTADAREAELTFTYGMTSVVVIVQQGVNPANKLGYELVTNASTLAVGDEVIIVTLNANKALATPTKTNDTKFPSTDIEKTGNVIYDVEKSGVQTFILKSGETEGTLAFEFTYKDEVYYPYYSSGLKMRTSVNAAASWTISIDEVGNASISTVSSSKDYLLKFNSAAASLTFTTYLSTATNATKAENAVCIYKKQTK